MTEPTETERAKLNARLARAMGIPDDRWTFQCLKDDHLLDGHGPHAFCLTCAAPVSKSALVPPDFTRDFAASRELVEWMAAQEDAVWEKFFKHLCRSVPPDKTKWRLPADPGVDDIFKLAAFSARRTMTAPPLLIAIAADAATKGEG